jgi:cytochrome c peroxidase
VLLLLLACAESTERLELDWELIGTLSPMPAAPTDPTNAVAEDDDAADLGQRLYFDAALSLDGSVSCATCHDPEKGFADGKELAEGIETAGKNASTVLNTAWNRWFFWDGRADTAWMQALGPLEDPVEHGTNRVAVVRAVYADGQLATAYEAIFGALPPMDDPRFPADARPILDQVDDPQNVAWDAMAPEDQEAVNIAFSNVGKAIAAYERHIVRIESPFDRFVAGDSAALSDAAQRGLATFTGAGNCTLCHSGPELTDREFHNLALGPRDWLGDDPDYGRYAGISKLRDSPFNGGGVYSDDPEAGASKVDHIALTDEQIGQHKTPSLRNVALTAPYMHGGHFADLDEVLHFYNTLDEEGGEGHREEILKPLELSDEEIADLRAFLESLTGDAPDARWTEAPG